MKYFLILLFITGTYGCEYQIGSARQVTGNYICNDEQMNKVEKETLFCNNNSGYVKNYCYDTAIMRNCEKMKRVIN